MSVRKERNPLLGVPDLVFRFQSRSIGARVLMGVLAIALLAGLVYWGYMRHDLSTTLITLVVVGALVVASQLARRRRER